MSLEPKRLALLTAGSLGSNIFSIYGDYSAVFTEFFRQALPTKDVKFTLDPYDVVHKMEYPSESKIDSYDGLIITGSAASVYENLEWINKLIDYIARIAREKPRIKIIGICFGHQIIGRAFGSECVPNSGKWEVGPTSIELTELGKVLFGVETLNIQQMHRDHVPTVPHTFHHLGSTPISYNQGMVRFLTGTESEEQKLENIQIFAVQGHPEFVEGIVSRLVASRTESGLINAETAADAERRKNWRNDGIEVVGKAIWGILGVTA